MAKKDKAYIGIDLGGTNIQGGVVNSNGKVIANDRVKTKADGGEDVVIKRISKLVQSLCNKADCSVKDITGLGIGAPGAINIEKGIVIEAVNLRWTEYPLASELKKELDAGDDLGIDLEEKAFYDILKSLAIKYDFTYPEDKLIEVSKAVKQVVDDKVKYTDWSQRDDIKAELKVDLILVLADHGYPPVDRDEVYKEIYEQAENFKKHRTGPS